MNFFFPGIPVLPDLSRPFPGGPFPRSFFFAGGRFLYPPVFSGWQMGLDGFVRPHLIPPMFASSRSEREISFRALGRFP
jgi:hypothetical protein